MGSRLVTFRIPEDLYEEFQQKCSDDGVTVSERLRKFIDNSIYPGSKPQAMREPRAEAEQTTVDEGDEDQKLDADRLYYLEERIDQLDEVMVSVLERLDRIEESIGMSSREKTETTTKPEKGGEESKVVETQANPAQKPPWPLSAFIK